MTAIKSLMGSNSVRSDQGLWSKLHLNVWKNHRRLTMGKNVVSTLAPSLLI